MKSKKKAAPFISGPEAWWLFAADDRKAAAKLLEDGPWNLVCFHSQQGAEKALKAFLRLREGNVPRVHSLAKLIELCAQHDRTFLRLKSIALSLDRYYIPTRYPEAAPGSLPDGLPNQADAKSAAAELQKVLRFIKPKLTKPASGPLGF
jgi:HEPN domain-containing protein